MKETIDVLLATHNGEAYLEDLLVSIRNQKNVNINLIISDDNSTDTTLEILNRFEKSFSNFRIYSGPNKGPTENFRFLIQKSTSNYIALCDQDDLWLPEHLSNSIKRLKDLDETKPLLSFSAVSEFRKGKIRKTWPRKILEPISIENALTENLARGCTLVFNKNLADIFEKNENMIYMHDWYLFILALSCGSISFTEKPEILYRLHQNNYVGSPRQFTRIYRNAPKFKFTRQQWMPLKQAMEIYASHKSDMDGQKLLRIENFLFSLQQSGLPKLKYLMDFELRLRNGRIENLLLKAYLALAKVTI